MKRMIFMTLTVIGLTLAFGNNVNAQDKQAAAGKEVKIAGQKVTDKKNLPTATDNPREKKTRGFCYVYFNNPTGYYVDIWVENIYQGRLSPYAKSVRIDVWVPGNWTKWYAQTAGGTYYWTNSSFCNDSRVFTVSLN